MSREAMIEEELLLGLDERAAEAIVDENTSLEGMAVVVKRIEEAQQQPNAA